MRLNKVYPCETHGLLTLFLILINLKSAIYTCRTPERKLWERNILLRWSGFGCRCHPQPIRNYNMWPLHYISESTHSWQWHAYIKERRKKFMNPLFICIFIYWDFGEHFSTSIASTISCYQEVKCISNLKCMNIIFIQILR